MRTLAACALGACLWLWTESSGPVSARALATLRVCSDPNNLPFSSRDGTGFEDAIARVLGVELGRTVTYYYAAQRRGFVRNTLKAGHCDLVMGVPRGSDLLLTTDPYYRASYVFATRAELAPVRSFDDPRLHRLRVGVPLLGDDYQNPPPVHALSRRGISANVRGFSVFGDYREPSPPLELLRALSRGEIDVAIAWGPLAGFAAKRAPGTLSLSPVRPAREGPYRFAFEIALGVHPQNRPLRDELNRALRQRHRAIQEILREYGVLQP